MSAPKFQCASYKLFEPDYHPQKPIIVGLDDRLESPETLTLRYEEAARAASGGDPRGDSPPRILDMAAYGKPAPLPSMHGYDSSRFSHAPYEPYPPPAFPQTAEKFAQLNQQAFSTNSAVNTGVPAYMPAGPAVLSYQPQSGGYGTKIFLKFSTQYDLFALSTAMPYFSLQFGPEKCPMHDVTRDAQDNGSFVYSCSADAPQILVTGSESNSVPLSLVIDGPTGEEISRTVVGSFQYLSGSGDGITGTGKGPKHDSTTAAPPPAHHESVSPKTDAPLTADPTTNNYEDPSQQAPYGNATFSQGPPEMISTYRSSSFADPPYHRRSAHGWAGFPGTLGSTGRSPILGQPGLTSRAGLTSLPIPSSGAGTPQLVRTSTITSAGGSGPYHHVSLYSSKAVLKINGRLESMTEAWTQEEWTNRRRIVMFRRSQVGSTLTASFRAVPVNERPPNSICVSCIYWTEKDEYFVTSVDTIYLLEQLVAAPNRFSVEEKNRIRRNLEGFHPLTVSKVRQDSEEFFKLIMSFPNPKPRNIEKDVKVFTWKTLESALKKIIGKYSASPGAGGPIMAPTTYTMPTPPGPGPSLSTQNGDHHSQYSVHSSHHDAIPSPRSLSGSQPGWTPYSAAPAYAPAAVRPLSPNMRLPSPQHPPSIRVNTNPLPAVTTYDTRTVTTGGYASTGLHTPISHHPSTSTPPRWDPTPAPYADGYPSLASQHPPSSQPVYTGATASYNDGAVPRA